MALSIGILLGVMAKKDKKGLSRLRKFRQKVLKLNKNQITIHQLPSKIIFSILFIIILAIFLEWFAHQCHTELRIKIQLPQNIQTNELIIQPSFFKQSKLNQADKIIVNQNQLKTQVIAQQLKLMRKLIFILEVFLLMIIIMLISMLTLKVIKVNRKDRCITMIRYAVYGWKVESQRYIVKQDDRVEIWMVGQDRFTNTNYYYSIVVVDGEGSCEIIEKSNLFEARKVAINLGVTLGLKYSVKVINKTDTKG